LKVASESFTVVPHPADGEISLLIGGLKIVLDLDEARALTAQLISGMKVICRVERVGDRIARSTPELAVVEPAAGALTPAGIGPPAPTSFKEAPGRGDGTADLSPGLPALIDPPLALLATAQPPPDEAAEEPEKKSGKKLRSLFKALVKEDDSSFSGGL
jgi:hypothetical protein